MALSPGEINPDSELLKSAGVPQGGILSPLLFSIFINLITPELQCAYHLYADDLQLYRQSVVDDLPSAISKLNSDLTAVQNWSKRFGIAVNPNKCQAIIIGSSRNLGSIDGAALPPISYNGVTVPFSRDVKDLGLIIDSTLSWRAQVTSVCQRVTGSLRALYRLRNFLPSSVKTQLVQTLIFPIIDYADVCYYDLNADLLNKLDRLLNNCIRSVFNLRKYDHISAHRMQLKWLPIRLRRQQRALTTLFSYLDSPSSPTYLASYFQYTCANHTKFLRSSQNRHLQCISHRTDFFHSSFFIQAVILWNALPKEIRMATSRNSFKFKVREHLLKHWQTQNN